jgi:AraC-like DNA-binding protein
MNWWHHSGMNDAFRPRPAAERARIWRVPPLAGIEAFEAHFFRFSYARHTHDSYALGVLDAGAMSFWHDGAVRTATPGAIIAINPAEVHDGHAASDEGCTYRMLYIERAAIDRLLERDCPQIGRSFALRGPIIDDRALERTMRRLHRALVEVDAEPSGLLRREELLIHVMLGLFARHGEPAIVPVEAATEKRCVVRAKDYLAQHVDAPVRLRELADHVGLSPYYFLRTFKKATGLPPHCYLNLLRVQRARAMLRAGEPAVQVAAALGFVDQSHLSRRFKSAFGVTPGQYAGAFGRRETRLP